jgi:hypothetical protein
VILALKRGDAVLTLMSPLISARSFFELKLSEDTRIGSRKLHFLCWVKVRSKEANWGRQVTSANGCSASRSARILGRRLGNWHPSVVDAKSPLHSLRIDRFGSQASSTEKTSPE